MNLVIQTGRLTKDPKIGTSQGGGNKYATFSIAVERSFSRGDKKEVDYHDCVAFNRQNGSQMADFAEKYLKKGKPITVIGALQNRSFTPNGSDKKVTKTEIIVERIEFVPSFGGGNREQGAQPEAAEEQAPAADSDNEWADIF